MAKPVKINPDAWYTLQDIVSDKMLPWAGSYHAVRQLVVHEMKKTHLLRPIVTGKGTNVRYKLKGENIIKFIKAVETGAVRL